MRKLHIINIYLMTKNLNTSQIQILTIFLSYTFCYYSVTSFSLLVLDKNITGNLTLLIPVAVFGCYAITNENLNHSVNKIKNL